MSPVFSIPVLFDIQAFQDDLLNWYAKNKRTLPWRENQDPYRIWVSEIMLQQTQVDTVIPYFNQFMERYPTTLDLAQADEQEVLKSWEGLGYYSRARNLHEAVKEVANQYGGVVPNNKQELKKLKGIGPYTLGAVLSIAFNQPEPAVDGNVMRVLSRILHIEEDIAKTKTKKIFEEAVMELMAKDDPASFNQALMELGALICHPKNPKCDACPVRDHCLAREIGDQTELPIKTKNKKQKRETFYSLVLTNSEGEYLLQQRPSDGLLANLWEFPLVSQHEFGLKELVEWFELEYGAKIELKQGSNYVKHIFSHVIWEVEIVTGTIIEGEVDSGKGVFVSKNDMKKYPMPNVQQKIKKYI